MNKRKLVQAVGCAILTVCTAGCGGLNASQSVSPLDFLLPGLIQNRPAPATPPAISTNTVSVVAQVRP